MSFETLDGDSGRSESCRFPVPAGLAIPRLATDAGETTGRLEPPVAGDASAVSTFRGLTPDVDEIGKILAGESFLCSDACSEIVFVELWLCVEMVTAEVAVGLVVMAAVEEGPPPTALEDVEELPPPTT